MNICLFIDNLEWFKFGETSFGSTFFIIDQYPEFLLFYSTMRIQ
jgi:hypothetical protein